MHESNRNVCYTVLIQLTVRRKNNCTIRLQRQQKSDHDVVTIVQKRSKTDKNEKGFPPSLGSGLHGLGGLSFLPRLPLRRRREVTPMQSEVASVGGDGRAEVSQRNFRVPYTYFCVTMCLMELFPRSLNACVTKRIIIQCKKVLFLIKEN